MVATKGTGDRQAQRSSPLSPRDDHVRGVFNDSGLDLPQWSPMAAPPRVQASRSSPTPRGRCWTPCPSLPTWQTRLRSLPAPRGRCWRRGRRGVRRLAEVAILTGPEGTVLVERADLYLRVCAVAMPPRPRGDGAGSWTAPACPAAVGSDPRRPRGDGAGRRRQPSGGRGPYRCDPHQPHRVHLRHGPAPHQGHHGPRLPGAGLAMAFKLIESAQTGGVP